MRTSDGWHSFQARLRRAAKKVDSDSLTRILLHVSNARWLGPSTTRRGRSSRSIRERASPSSGAGARQTAPEAGTLPTQNHRTSSRFHNHRHAHPYEVRKEFRVPVREAKAA